MSKSSSRALLWESVLEFDRVERLLLEMLVNKIYFPRSHSIFPAGAKTMQESNIGAIGTVELPGRWSNTAGTGGRVGLAWERVFNFSGQDRVEIIFKYRGVPIDEASRKVLNFLTAQGPIPSLDREQILALHTVLGVATVGDNQYTNNNEPGSLEGPRFHLDQASVVTISGRNVLRVRGRFVNNLYYDGIFYTAGKDGRVVEELFLQSPEMADFDSIKEDYQTILDSIVWR